MSARRNTAVVWARALVLLAATSFTAAALDIKWGTDDEFDENKVEWKEIEAKIPPYPKDGNLVQFDAGPASPHRFYIDTQSLSIGDDGVVRYVLVVKAAGGAVNVTYEGIRCDSREQKYYAVGHAGGGWTRARNPQWRRIEYQDVNRHHGVLFTDFLCSGSSSERSPVASVKLIVERLKYGQPAKITE